MKLGIGYLYTIFRYGYPPKSTDDVKALAEIRELGFRFVEMEGLGQQHTEAVWQDRARLRRTLDDLDMRMHNFCAVDPRLVSLDTGLRNAALQGFERSVELADYLGADTVHLASYAPPVEFVGKAPYQLDQDYSFGDTFRIRVPADFAWSRVWDALVDSCARCADVAAKHGKTVIMEPRVGETIASVDSMLRLIEHVGRPNFQANFDTAHFSAQRENVVLALHKLRGRFAKIHVADNLPVDTDHLALGRGSIDWKEFFSTLVAFGWDGYLSLDLGGGADLVERYRESAAYLQALSAELGFPLER